MTMSSPGMTAADSLQSHPASLKNAMLGNSLNHILTACRRIPAARWKQRRDDILVDQHRKYG
jgi:hypothetical protein